MLPARFDPSSSLQPMKSRIKSALLYLKNVAPDRLLDTLRYGPPVLRAEGKRSQDQEVQGALRKVDSSAGILSPLTST